MHQGSRIVNKSMSRRDCLLACVSLGSLRLAPGLLLADAAYAVESRETNISRRPTPRNEIGPFYKRLAPGSGQLRRANDPGLPLAVSGRVYSVRGDALANAKVEVWQADHFGLYDLGGYHYRAALSADSSGAYSFASIMPGHYPARVCQHVHYVVTAEGYKPLITQLYFATDPVFEGDPDRNYGRDPLVLSRDLVRPVTLVGDPREIEAHVSFDLVLERL
jgi:protocatechuate 3,4-dioxygenase beta subunit